MVRLLFTAAVRAFANAISVCIPFFQLVHINCSAGRFQPIYLETLYEVVSSMEHYIKISGFGCILFFHLSEFALSVSLSLSDWRLTFKRIVIIIIIIWMDTMRSFFMGKLAVVKLFACRAFQRHMTEATEEIERKHGRVIETKIKQINESLQVVAY